MLYKRSSALFKDAQEVIPGGVNSPVRAFKGVGGTPIFAKSAKGAYVYDEDGNRYIDYINSWGPMLLGHAFKPVVEAVRLKQNRVPLLACQLLLKPKLQNWQFPWYQILIKFVL